ncbi:MULTISPECIES: zinc metallopeptidase [unclassified Ruminococcus]|uniref:zinc metallopeptidase n=1 Tax=unclassified Ruminococcus TaxID=2608920 RepID=UPI00210C9CF9|nr:MULTISPECIES: zinc metallopeptidase [unclassified Ruminococcus]MCQ4022591.1 peptidase [Ruminococcus sp. zg-924]MCQ4114831.1 peptidase [Ruminococcus sp. zg-921]
MCLYYFDKTYLIFIVPAIIISFIASARVNSAFNKYSKIGNRRALTGAQAAYNVLASHGITNVRIEHVRGKLTDHFDPRTNTIRLSDAVYSCTTIAAVGVAAHEAGHAVQHAVGYVPNKIRSAIVPVVNIGSKLSWIVILVGLFLPVQYDFVLYIGIVLYSLTVVFSIVTLPVEFNASRRALQTIKSTNMLSAEDEYSGARAVLSAAAMTYVASAFASIMSLLRLLVIAAGRSNRR